jgi:peroxiredoxin
MFNGDVSVKIPYASGEQKAHLFLYRFDKSDPERGAKFKDYLFYYRDYALSGEVKLGEKTYGAMLVDETVSGDFRGAEGKSSGVRFLIDVNEDGKFDSRREGYDIRAPFNIGGTTYEIADLTAAGSFKLVKSSKTVEEIKPAPSLSKGSKAPAFTAKTTDGKERNFPGDYKGKVVLLDFWATWCGPCVREIPNVVANYEKYHEKGFEILGISLDRADAEEKLASFTKDHNMPWPQVYDGKYWQARVGQLYGIQSIPAMLLIDGDTGEILAGTEARGPNLEPAIKSGLEKLTAKSAEK